MKYSKMDEAATVRVVSKLDLSYGLSYKTPTVEMDNASASPVLLSLEGQRSHADRKLHWR